KRGAGHQFEFTLAAIAQNLRRLGKLVARPPPPAAACVAWASCSVQVAWWASVSERRSRRSDRSERQEGGATAFPASPYRSRRRLFQQSCHLLPSSMVEISSSVGGRGIAVRKARAYPRYRSL